MLVGTHCAVNKLIILLTYINKIMILLNIFLDLFNKIIVLLN